jgi:hypothetical protein
MIMTPSHPSACYSTAKKPEDGQKKKGKPQKRNETFLSINEH